MMNRSNQKKIRMREKRRGIGFETVAGIGGGYRRNTPRKLVIAHGSVEFGEATPFDLVDKPKESLYGSETDRYLRSACRCVA